jgi:hypothetical protein
LINFAISANPVELRAAGETGVETSVGVTEGGTGVSDGGTVVGGAGVVDVAVGLAVDAGGVGVNVDAGKVGVGVEVSSDVGDTKVEVGLVSGVRVVVGVGVSVAVPDGRGVGVAQRLAASAAFTCKLSVDCIERANSYSLCALHQSSFFAS